MSAGQNLDATWRFTFMTEERRGEPDDYTPLTGTTRPQAEAPQKPQE